MNTQENEGRGDNAALTRTEVTPNRSVAAGYVNGKNGAAGSHSAVKRVVHLKQRSGRPGVCCGLDVRYFCDAVSTSTVGAATCRRCLRVYSALAALRHKARRFDRLAGSQPKRRTYKPQPLVSLATAFDNAIRA